MKRNALSIRELLSIIVLLVWMGFIFFMSAQNGEESTHTSNKTLEVLTEITEKLFPSNPPQQLAISDYIRSAGHFTEYFILGLFAFNLMRAFKRSTTQSLILSVFICLSYAASDEFHQLFVAGRACELSDWLVDLSGTFLACILYAVITSLKSRIKN